MNLELFPQVMTWLHSAAQFILSFKYVLIFFGSFVEGPILMMTSGFLLHEDKTILVPLVISLILGDLFGDVLWYTLGYYGLNNTIHRVLRFFKIDERMYEKAKELFHKHHGKVLFTSKVTLGLGIGVGIMLAAGAARVPFKRFLLINTVGAFFMVAGLMALGYFFGNLVHGIPVFTKIGIAALLVILIVFLLQKFFAKLRVLVDNA